MRKRGPWYVTVRKRRTRKLVEKLGPYERGAALVEARKIRTKFSPIERKKFAVHIVEDRKHYWSKYHSERQQTDEAYRERRRLRSLAYARKIRAFEKDIFSLLQGDER